MKTTLIFVCVVVLLYLGGGIFLTLNQRSMLYFPTPPVDHPFETEEFENEAERISVIVLNPGRERAVLYFGGNGESIARTAAQYQSLQSDRTIYLVNYRGYGRSTGSPSEAGLKSDARVIYNTLVSRHTGISLIGRSLGTGIASALATDTGVESLILVSPFDSIVNRAAARFPLYPVHWLLEDHFDSMSHAADIEAPTLVLMAEFDEVIPRSATVALFEALSSRTLASAVLDDTNHNTLSNHRLYLRYIEEHLAKN